ncbi:MAG: LptF/LptG family permease [Candidatus Firestonebacteria bacterium]
MHRYIIKEITAPLLLGFLVFTLIFLIDKTRELSELIVRYGVGLGPAAQLFLYILPAYIAITVPMGILFAVLFAFGRFNSDNEITAMKTNGVHIKEIILPVLILGLLLSISLIGFNDIVLPKSNYAFKTLYFKIVEKRAAVALQEKVFINDFDGFIFYVDEKSRDGKLKNITVYVLERQNSPTYTITAPEGLLSSDQGQRRVILKLINGSVHQINKENPLQYNLIRFDTYDLDLDINSILARTPESKGLRDMTFGELSTEISKYIKNGINSNGARIEFHKKIAIPFACLAFTLTGIALGISVRIKGSGWSMIISLALIVIYYFILVVGEVLAGKGALSPWLGMWLPNIIIGSIGAALLYLAMREKIKF